MSDSISFFLVFPLPSHTHEYGSLLHVYNILFSFGCGIVASFFQPTKENLSSYNKATFFQLVLVYSGTASSM